MRTLAKVGLVVAAGAVVAWLLRRDSGSQAAPEPAAAEPAAEAPEGYCVKERKRVRIKDPEPTVTKNGRQAIKGTCPDCGTKVFRFV